MVHSAAPNGSPSLKFLAFSSVCAAIAQRRLRTGEGNASFRTRLIDAMCNLTPETFRKWRQEA